MTALTPTTWLALQRRFYSNPRKGLASLKEGQLPDDLESFLPAAKKDLAQVEKRGLRMISWGDAAYPGLLKEIYDPPLLLLAKGTWSDWSSRDWVAVVGARKASPFSLQKTREAVCGLVRQNIGVVSGLAYGVDAQAHKATVESGGITWGVLGSGPDVLYPARNAALAQKMTGCGGYLSEFPLGTSPLAGHFPQRNRIVSGLSQAVIVIEASLKSGSLITARFALEQGREVFVVAPPREHVAYEGNKKLLEEGATPFESVEQVVEGIAHFKEPDSLWGSKARLGRAAQLRHGRSGVQQSPKGIRFSTQKVSASSLGTEIRRTETRKTENGEGRTGNSELLRYLEQPSSLDALSARSGREPQHLLSELLALEMEGLVQKLPGGTWQSL